jgi:hypothetical protein
LRPKVRFVSNGTEPPGELAEGAIAVVAQVIGKTECGVKIRECLVGEKIFNAMVVTFFVVERK